MICCIFTCISCETTHSSQFIVHDTIFCFDKAYYYYIVYAVYTEGKAKDELAFLLILKAKNEDVMMGYHTSEECRNLWSGNIYRKIQYYAGDIQVPNNDYIAYEVLSVGRNIPDTTCSITGKTKEKISPEVIEAFFNVSDRPSYDLSELLKYNTDFSKKSKATMKIHQIEDDKQ